MPAAVSPPRPPTPVMPSPFPGMDPFLEDPGQFPTLHGGLITAMMSQLQRTLPDGYLASANERVWIGEGIAHRRAGQRSAAAGRF